MSDMRLSCHDATNQGPASRGIFTIPGLGWLRHEQDRPISDIFPVPATSAETRLFPRQTVVNTGRACGRKP